MKEIIRKEIRENKYQMKYLEMKYSEPKATIEEWQQFCAELLIEVLKERD